MLVEVPFGFCLGSRDSTVVRALTSHQCDLGLIPGLGVIHVYMWVDFFVGSRPCSDRFFTGYCGFPLASKTNISNSNSIWNLRATSLSVVKTVKCHPH